MIVEGETVAIFVAERIGDAIVPPYTAFGLERDGELAVGVVLNVYTGPSVEATVAGGPWNRTILRELGRRAFDDLGTERIGFTTAQPQVAEMALRCGAKVEGIARSFYGPGRDGIILGVLRDEYRYYRRRT